MTRKWAKNGSCLPIPLMSLRRRNDEWRSLNRVLLPLFRVLGKLSRNCLLLSTSNVQGKSLFSHKRSHWSLCQNQKSHQSLHQNRYEKSRNKRSHRRLPLKFFLLYQLYKYLFLYQFDQPAEHDTGGLFFPKAIQHLFTGLYLQQICLTALFFLARDSSGDPSAIPQGALMVVLIVCTVSTSFDGPPLEVCDNSKTAFCSSCSI